MKYQALLGIIATLIAFVSYIPYIRDIIKQKTKPHAFSWFIWMMLTAIAFVAQITDNGGPGAWVTGFTALVSLFIFIAALIRGEKHVTKSDWISFIGALTAIPLWLITKDPLWSVIVITVIDALGFYPTFRKSFYKPHEETVFTYILSAIKFIIALAALTHVSMVTALYPASLVLMNGVFAVMVIVRRKKLNM